MSEARSKKILDPAVKPRDDGSQNTDKPRDDGSQNIDKPRDDGSQRHETTLSPKIRAAIDKWVHKYPPEYKQSAVLPALHIVQDAHEGWLTDELLNAVADYLGMPHIAVYEVATFYNMYDLKPVGKHKIRVCTNVSCMLSGCDVIVDHLQKRLGVKFNETSADGQFTLKEVECMAACAGGPMMQVDKTYYVNLTPEKVDEILDGVVQS